jgi:aspartyl-tRNA(Asn)/glutamyl-tRNA(Gln) amidotransferase subunit A
MALATIGTDTGGSIRIPAAACGIVGLKPTFGELPLGRVVPLSRTLDHLGPLALNVTDAWHVYRALRGQTTSATLEPVPADGLRLGVPRQYFCERLDDQVRDRFEAALDAIRGAGARVDEVAIAHASAIPSVYLHIVLSDAAAYHAATLETMPERYTAPVRQRLEMGRYVLAEDYVRALEGREMLRQRVDAVLETCDALVLPTLPIAAPPLGASSIRVGAVEEPVRSIMLRLTQLFNLTGHPAISLPCGTTSEGLPCGLQVVGARGETDALARMAASIEPLVA